MRVLLVLITLLMVTADAFAGGPRIFMAAAKRASVVGVPVTTNWDSGINDSLGGAWTLDGVDAARDNAGSYSPSYSVHIHNVGDIDYDEGGYIRYPSWVYHNYNLATGDITFRANATPGTVLKVILTSQSSEDWRAGTVIAEVIPSGTWPEITAPVSAGNAGQKRLWIVNDAPDTSADPYYAYIDDISVPVAP